MRRSVGWLGVVAFAAVLAGCLGAQSAVCGDGRICAPGTVCVAALDLCADPAQVEACRNVAEGDRCEGAGTCTDGVCLHVEKCGNGLIESHEACDDGNTAFGDGCSADCLSTEICGNRIVDRDEQCDCGNFLTNPACPGPNSDLSGPCSSDCKLRCGDGVVSSDEACDPNADQLVSCAGAAFDRGLTTCSASCQPMPSASCGYIGWRTRGSQSSMPITDHALFAAGRGFYIAGNEVGALVGYAATGTPFVAAAPLTAVWTLNASNAVAVGEQGTILRFDGVWTSDVVATTDLRDVWGRSGDDVYAIGDSTVLHWDGLTWSLLTPPIPGSFRAITGNADRIYVAGDLGTLLSFDGVTWQVEDTGTTEDLRGVWSADGLVVAVGAAGTIVQDDGTGWRRGRTAATAELLGVWGSASTGFFAVGERGTLLFDDGRVWRPLASGRGVTGSEDQTFLGITGVPGVEVGVIGTDDLITYEGAAWSPTAIPTTETIFGLWGSAPDDMFAVGRNGTILHHDGLTWTPQPTSTTVDLHAVWGTAPDDVYAAGDALTLLHYDGVTWTTLHTGPLDGLVGDFRAVFSAAVNEAVVAGTTGIYQVTGASFVRTSPVSERALWGTSTTNVFAAGTGIHRFDGSVWTEEANTTGELRAIGGSSSSSAHAVGSTSYFFNGASWGPGAFTDPALAAVGGTLDRGVFAAGDGGMFQHLSGFSVEPLVSRTTNDLNALFVIGDLVYLAGTDGTIEILVFHR